MDIGIIGAGVAGLGVALELDEANVNATVLEKEAAAGGRAATRTRRGCVYDHGANYITPDEDLEAFIEDLDVEGRIDIDAPVWTFDADGEIEPGEDRDRPSITYEGGIAEFPKRVLDRSGATLETGFRVETLAREGKGWRANDAEDRERAFDALVCTPPAPRSAAIVGKGDWDDPLRRDLATAIADVPYRTIVSTVLHYPFEIDRPYYALVNTDKDHEIGWLSCEGEKPGHVPDGESLLVVQMAPGWSLERYREPDDDIAAAAARSAAELLDAPRLAAPDWTDCTRWRHALPEGGVDEDVLDRATEHDLFFAGDWVAGEGRVGAAFENGRAVGGRIGRQ